MIASGAGLLVVMHTENTKDTQIVEGMHTYGTVHVTLKAVM